LLLLQAIQIIYKVFYHLLLAMLTLPDGFQLYIHEFRNTIHRYFRIEGDSRAPGEGYGGNGTGAGDGDGEREDEGASGEFHVVVLFLEGKSMSTEGGFVEL